MKKTRGSATTYYVGDLLEISGSVTTSSYQFNGQIVAMRDSSAGVSYLHGDHLGSVSLATNASGTVLSRQEFDPWGKLRSGGISQTDMNYTGQRLDGTGLLYYHARMYDPALARFVSADSIVPGVGALTLWPGDETAEKLWKQGGKGAGPKNPQDLNRFSYVGNNPVVRTDPTGHDWEDFKQYCAGIVEGMGQAGETFANLFKAETWRNAGRGLEFLSKDPKGALNVLREVFGKKVETMGRGLDLLTSDPQRALQILRQHPRELGRILGQGLGVYTLGAAYANGTEIRIGTNFRVAPFGNRTGNPLGELPHYHRRVVDRTTGKTAPGQGIGRHRPWERKSPDRSFRDRF